MPGTQQDDVLLAGRSLRGRRHVCAFFNTRDEEYRTLLPFVQEGFARGEKAIHIVDPALRADHLARLHAAGIDVEGARSRKQLEVNGWTDTFLPQGTFDERATVARVKALLTKARADGFSRARVLGHGDWALKDSATLTSLVEYEARINDVLPDFDAAVVCVYDRSRLGGDTVVDLIRAHSMAVLDCALLDNPFFASRSILLSRMRGPTISVLHDRFLVALVAGARREALDVVLEEALWEDVPVPSVYLGVVQAALYDIGRLWEQNVITVAQEHAATEIARLALAQLRLHLPCAASNGKHVVVACVEGELHDVGARVTADFLEMAGFEVQFLGANVPTTVLTELVRQRPPQLLALSATATASVSALRRAIAAVRSVTEARVPVAAGGQVFARRPNLAAQLGLKLHAGDAHEAVAMTRRVLGD